MSEPYPSTHTRARRQHANFASGRASSSRGLSAPSTSDISPERPRKRTKAIFAKDWQVRILKKLYQEDAHPSDAQKRVAAAETGLDVKWISAWFQRHNNPNRKNSLAAIAADGLASFSTSASSPDTSFGSCPPESGPAGSGVPAFHPPFPPANFNSAGGWAGDQAFVLDSNRASLFPHPPGQTLQAQKEEASAMLRGPGVNPAVNARPYNLALPNDDGVNADSPYRPASSSSLMPGNTSASSGSSPSARPDSLLERLTSFSSTGAEHHAYSLPDRSVSASLGHSQDPGDQQPIHLPGIQSMLFNNPDEHLGYANASPALPALLNQAQTQVQSEDIVAPRPVHYTVFAQTPGLGESNDTLAFGRLIPSHFPAVHAAGSAPGLAFPVPGSFPFPYQHAHAVAHNLSGEQATFRHPPPPIAFLCRFEDVSALARRLRSTYYADTEHAAEDKKSPLSSDQSRFRESTLPNADDEDKENLPPATIEQSCPADSIDGYIIGTVSAAAPLPAPDAPGAEHRPAHSNPDSRDAADGVAPVQEEESASGAPTVAGGIES